MSTIRILSLTLGLALSLAACKKKEADAAGGAKTAEGGGAAKAGTKHGIDFAAIKAKVEAAKSKEDFEALLEPCMGALMDLGLKGIKEPDKDPDYRATCKVAVARQRAKVVIAESKPDNMHVMCLTAAMQTDELAQEGGPEAAEMKQLAADVNKACGL